LNRLFKILKRYRDRDLVKVASHPRSGTHFIESFLGRNFYKDRNLAVYKGNWGHWSNRKQIIEPVEYGRLFYTHAFPNQNVEQYLRTNRLLYIYRDPRAVAYSVWKTPNFVHKQKTDISFDEFIELKLDWHGSPAYKVDTEFTIFEHWERHVKSWYDLSLSSTNLLMINYEQLVENPYEVYLAIKKSFFPGHTLLLPNDLDPVKRPVGLLPNAAKSDAWRLETDISNFSKVDKMLEEKPFKSLFK